jgi:hypothetical protein
VENRNAKKQANKKQKTKMQRRQCMKQVDKKRQQKALKSGGIQTKIVMK